MDSIPATDEQMSALRGNAHLAMKDVPNEKAVDHLNKFHAKHTEQLSQMCSHLPGGESCPPEDVMPRAIQHLSTLKTVGKKLGITHMSAGPEGTAQLLSRIDSMATASEQLSQKDNAIRERDTQIQQLSAKVVHDLPPDAEKMVCDSLSGQFDLLPACGIAPHVVAGLKRVFLHNGERGNTIMLSKAASFGDKAPIVELLNLLKSNAGYKAPETGDKTPTQMLSRIVPGDPDANKASEKDLAESRSELSKMASGNGGSQLVMPMAK